MQMFAFACIYTSPPTPSKIIADDAEVKATLGNTSLFPTLVTHHLNRTPQPNFWPLSPPSLMFAEELKSMRRLGWRHVLLPFSLPREERR